MVRRLNRNAERRPHPPCEDKVVRIEFESFLIGVYNLQEQKFTGRSRRKIHDYKK
jgi:hypothetical protein